MILIKYAIYVILPFLNHRQSYYYAPYTVQILYRNLRPCEPIYRPIYV